VTQVRVAQKVLNWKIAVCEKVTESDHLAQLLAWRGPRASRGMVDPIAPPVLWPIRNL
jgi:hypothetical protein